MAAFRTSCAHWVLILSFLSNVNFSLPLVVNPGAIPAPKVLCHGEVLYDCISLPSAAGWGLEKMVAEGAWKPYPGGAPANVAWGLAKLGASTAFAGVVGDDDDGKALLAEFVAAGVDASLVGTAPAGRTTRTVMVTRNAHGERTFAGFGGGHGSAEFADCLAAPAAATAAAARAPWLVQGTLGLACPESARSHRELAAAAAGGGGTRLLDVNWRPVFWNWKSDSNWEAAAQREILDFAEGADVVKLTDDEAEWLLGVPQRTALVDPAAVRRRLPGVKAVLVTGGERGASYDVLGHCGAAPPFQVNSVETTGAGDAFTAGFVSRMLDFDFKGSGGGVGGALALTGEARAVVDAAVRFASACGALTCCGEGAVAAQPTAAQVMEFLWSHNEAQQPV